MDILGSAQLGWLLNVWKNEITLKFLEELTYYEPERDRPTKDNVNVLKRIFIF